MHIDHISSLGFRTYWYIMAWKRFLHYWPFVKENHRSAVMDSAHNVPLMRFFDVSFLANLLNKESSCRQFQAPRHSCNVTVMNSAHLFITAPADVLAPIGARQAGDGTAMALKLDILPSQYQLFIWNTFLLIWCHHSKGWRDLAGYRDTSQHGDVIKWKHFMRY